MLQMACAGRFVSQEDNSLTTIRCCRKDRDHALFKIDDVLLSQIYARQRFLLIFYGMNMFISQIELKNNFDGW